MTSRFDPANCINIGLCQNNFKWRWHAVCLPCQDNLKNLTDTESDDENLYICNVEPPGPAYILAKVFSCPLWEIRSFQRQKVRYLFPLVHVHAVSPRFCGSGTPYMPSVEFYL